MEKCNSVVVFKLKNAKEYKFDVFWHLNSIVENLEERLDEKIVNRIYFSKEFGFFFSEGIESITVYLKKNPEINSPVYLDDNLAVLSSEFIPVELAFAKD